jgi:molecular chaperone DnaK
MVKDAEMHAEEDRGRQRDVEAHNRADTTHYQIQKFMQDNQDKLSDDDKRLLQEKMDAVRSALDRNANAEELDRLTDLLNDTWQQVGTRIHQQAGPAQGGPYDQTPPPGAGEPGGPTDQGGEDVVEGEYRNV